MLLPVILAAFVVVAETQVSYVEVSEDSDEVEKRYTPELVSELKTVKDDALLLYTEYTGTHGAEMNIFIRNLYGFTNDTLSVFGSELDYAPATCKESLYKRLRKIEVNAHRAASFSAENHHKFFLGNMIVMRMHLNKSEDLVQKCDREITVCGIACETSPKLLRWRRHALAEIHRVRDDIIHTRRFYKDLLLHSRRRLNHIKKIANTRAQDALTGFRDCVKNG